MKEEQFNKVISDLTLAFEKAGVNDPELKKSIDSLFDLKELVLLRDSATGLNGSCFRCANYDKGTCNFLSAKISEDVKLELTPPNKDRVKVKVPMSCSCKFYKA
jgi:hypothetical protein